MSREFVDSVISGNNLEAEKAFSTAITTKAGDALEIKRKEISANFVKNVSPEPEGEGEAPPEEEPVEDDKEFHVKKGRKK